MKRWSPMFNLLRRLHRSTFFEKLSLFGAMYIVTVSLFWFETGMLSKGLLFGLIAASLKTAIASGHAKVFGAQCAPEAVAGTACPECASIDDFFLESSLMECEANNSLRWDSSPQREMMAVQTIPR